MFELNEPCTRADIGTALPIATACASTSHRARRIRPRRSLIAGFAVLVMVVGACGDDAAAPPATTTTTAPSTTETTPPTTSSTEPPAPVLANPCELVTADEAAAILGLEVGEGTLSEQADTNACRYNASPSGPVGQVEIYVGYGTEQILATDQRLGHEFAEVEGIGDEALEKDMHLFFRIDQTWYLIRLVRIDDPSAYTEPLRELAATAADRAQD